MSVINMMNNQKNKKFIFVTPYLDEVDRIQKECSGRCFCSPHKEYDNGFSKLNHINYLIKNGQNIASTHALFGYYTEETKQLIRDNNYTLVFDEVMDVLNEARIGKNDLNILKKSGTVDDSDGIMQWKDGEYNEGLFEDVMFKSKSNNLTEFNGSYVFWTVPADVFMCFKEVYLLTYMFEYQVQKYFFDINNIDYELIGTKKINDIYQFCPLSEMDRRIDLKSKIHILDNTRLNEIGYNRTAFSMNWYKRKCKAKGKPEIKQLQHDIYNIFKNIYKAKADETMWTSYEKFMGFLRGKGYTKGFLVFNKRASNDFSNKKYLSYCVNIFMQPWIKEYFRFKGVEVNEDMYSLSILIQWIFRSAIRKGNEIWIYIPSRRMRLLLTKWLDNLYNGYDLDNIKLNLKNYRE